MWQTCLKCHLTIGVLSIAKILLHFIALKHFQQEKNSKFGISQSDLPEVFFTLFFKMELFMPLWILDS